MSDVVMVALALACGLALGYAVHLKVEQVRDRRSKRHG